MKYEFKRTITSTYLGNITGDVERIDCPREHFLRHMIDLEQITSMIKGKRTNSSDMEEMHKRLSAFQQVYLLRYGPILATAGYSSMRLGKKKLLEVEKISLSEELRNKDVFSLLTQDAKTTERIICLRNDLRCPYLEQLCEANYPATETPVEIKLAFLEESAKGLIRPLSERDRILIS